MFNKRRRDKQTLVYLYDGTLVSNKRNGLLINARREMNLRKHRVKVE